MRLNLNTSELESQKNHLFWVVNGETTTGCFARFYSTEDEALSDAKETAETWWIGATIRVLRKAHGRDYQTIYQAKIK